jgi:NAD+ kinase
MMRFGFLLKRGKREAVQTGTALAQCLIELGHTVAVLEENATLHAQAKVVPSTQLGSSIDVMVVLGGDGTFLSAAALVADHGVPLMGINLGGLGFLTHYGLDEARAAVLAACEGRLEIAERMRLEVVVRTAGQPDETRVALNEAAITQPAIARLLDLSAELDGVAVSRYRADGLIVSTPTGSTAYNLAAGGPILTPDLEAIVMTPICPHTLTNRPVVVRPDSRIVVTNRGASAVTLTIDGQWSRELGPNDAIEVFRAARPLRTFRPKSPFFAILRQKLAWGERAG